MTLFEVADELADRLIAIFLRDADGRRPVYGGTEQFQDDPHWRDLILFYEYFHGDNGAGLGASHQTGWTGLVAQLIQLFGHLDAGEVLRARTPTPWPASTGDRRHGANQAGHRGVPVAGVRFGGYRSGDGHGGERRGAERHARDPGVGEVDAAHADDVPPRGQAGGQGLRRVGVLRRGQVVVHQLLWLAAPVSAHTAYWW